MEDLETSWGEVEIMEVVAILAEVSSICIPVELNTLLQVHLIVVFTLYKRSFQIKFLHPNK